MGLEELADSINKQLQILNGNLDKWYFLGKLLFSAYLINSVLEKFFV